jgi:ribonuclease BN (tRNA processing enzyme)
VVLLGTGGGGNPKTTRAGFANAVVVDHEAYVIDCGEGVHRQLWRAGIAMNRGRLPQDGSAVRALFLTHLHSDHVIDIANLFLGFWPAHQIPVYGPGPAGLPIPAYPPDSTPPPLFRPEEPTPGTAAMLEHLMAAYAYNINVRIADEGRADVTRQIVVKEIGVSRDGYRPDIDLGVSACGASAEAAAPPMEPVEIYPTDDRGVRVTAILVQHAPVFPALAYRFDTPDGSVVFSGDTGPCENVARLARDADILIHEVIDLEWMERRLNPSLPNRDAVLSHLAVAHTTPDQAGAIATKANVGTLVLSHLVPGDNELTAEEWEAKTRPHFTGSLMCGRDLDELALG